MKFLRSLFTKQSDPSPDKSIYLLPPPNSRNRLPEFPQISLPIINSIPPWTNRLKFKSEDHRTLTRRKNRRGSDGGKWGIEFSQLKHFLRNLNQCYKRLGFDNESFDANKRLKQDFASTEEPFFSVTRNAHVYDSHHSGSSLPWFACKPSREETLDCQIVHPDTYEKGSQINSTKESFFSIYESAPRKAIPVGPNYQADIPDFNPEVLIEEESNKWTSAGFLPKTDLDQVWNGKECDCVDMGSIRCIKQHIIEVREDMKKKLGMEKFIQLGFGDMGEEVALTWDPQEEKLFAEAVRSNPASFMKHFWDILPLAFPERCKREFVSYYFNVYILRKRAGQNRSDPLYINSDDDEWEATEERVESEDELEMHDEEEQDDNSEEEDCSGLESSIGQLSNVTCHGDDIGLSSDVIEEAEETGDGEEAVLPKTTDGSRSPGLAVQDDSCMSFEELHDQFPWDTGFMCANKDELFPTFHVIEEVFGKGSCDK